MSLTKAEEKARVAAMLGNIENEFNRFIDSLIITEPDPKCAHDNTVRYRAEMVKYETTNNKA